MINVVAYPDLVRKKFTGLDPNEDAKGFLQDQQAQVTIRTNMMTDRELYLVQY